MAFENYKCSQCGAKEFIEEGKDKLRCSYCKSLFYIEKSDNDQGVIINKGAKVIFKPSAKIIIRGKLVIDDNAEVVLDGAITLIESSSKKDIKKAKLKLKRSKHNQ